MRWFTGSPCNFVGTEAFYDRESGLTSRGFQALGMESGAITLGPAMSGDHPAMVRASWQQLTDTAWWAKQQLDGLVLYTWGNSKFHDIVEAAVKAGIRVAQVTDTQGVASPVSDWRAHIQAERAHFWYEPRWKQLARTLVKLPLTLTVRVVNRDRHHARTIAAGEFFFAPTPRAAERFQALVRRLLGAEAARKVRFVPVPVNFHFTHSPDIPKIEDVVAVGRWDSLQKRTPLLMATISRALTQRPTTRYRIFGRITPELENWHTRLPAAQRDQVVLEGLVTNSQLALAYQRARIMLVSAAYEGCHNSSAEAICCGTTVVACRSPFLGALEWHASKNSGRLSDQDSAAGLAAALLDELAAWDRGERDPAAISQAWTREMHPDRVATRILEIFGLKPPHPAS